MQNDLSQRKARYYELNEKLHYCSNEQLLSLIGKAKGEPYRSKNMSIYLDGTPMFIKRVPLSQLEKDNSLSTANLFELPLFFNYNVGTVGINLYRELIALNRTTNWVLTDVIEHFPMMYHYRILPIDEKRLIATEQNQHHHSEQLKSFLQNWDDNANIGKYLTERGQAQYELVIFIEYMPITLEDWIHDNMEKLDDTLATINKIVDFIAQQGMVHFDVHFGNIMMNNGQPYLTDFGLVLDQNFDLTEQERQFMVDHSYYDYGEYLTGIIHHLAGVFKLVERDIQSKLFKLLNINKLTPQRDVMMALLNNIESISDSDLLDLSAKYVKTIVKYRKVVLFMMTFNDDIENNSAKNTHFDNQGLKQLLQDCAVI